MCCRCASGRRARRSRHNMKLYIYNVQRIEWSAARRWNKMHKYVLQIMSACVYYNHECLFILSVAAWFLHCDPPLPKPTYSLLFCMFCGLATLLLAIAFVFFAFPFLFILPFIIIFLITSWLLCMNKINEYKIDASRELTLVSLVSLAL